MSGIELIVAALTAGAAAGTTDVAKGAVLDAYTGLRVALRQRLAGRPGAGAIVEPTETDLDVWRARISAELAEVHAGEDDQLVAAAVHLLEVADPHGTRSGKYGGDVHVGTAYGPVAREMTGPVTVNYGQVPPVPPAAH